MSSWSSNKQQMTGASSKFTTVSFPSSSMSTAHKQTSKSSSSTTTSAYAASAQHYEQHHTSSINKNVLDKAAMATIYKSPDMLAALRSAGAGAGGIRATTSGGIAALAGSKYQSVYARNAAGELLSSQSQASNMGMGAVRGVGTTVGAAAAVASLAVKPPAAAAATTTRQPIWQPTKSASTSSVVPMVLGATAAAAAAGVTKSTAVPTTMSNPATTVNTVVEEIRQPRMSK